MTPRKEEPQKRGAKGHFAGSRHKFLTGYLNEYIALRGKSRIQFWHKLYNAWWEKYPWRLPDSEEPPTDNPERMKELARVETDADAERKSEVENALRDRVSAWFSYRSSTRNNQSGNIWSSILRNIHRQTNSKPRCRTAAQQLMLENPEAVDRALAERYPNAGTMTRVVKMNKRNDLARELVATDFKDQEAQLIQRAKEKHQQGLDEWAIELENIEEAEDVQLARDSLLSAVYPLLKFIGGYAGCYVTLLAAAPGAGDEKPYFSTVHHFPQTAGKRLNWTEFDETSFKDGVVCSFFKYIHWMEGVKEKKGDAELTLPGITTTAHSSKSPPAVAVPSKITPAPPQPKGNKKRTIVELEDVSEDDEDVDMDDIEDNDSSGSSVGPDHVPAKRLRTSMTTRSIAATSTRAESTTEADGDLSPLSTPTAGNLGPSLGDPTIKSTPRFLPTHPHSNATNVAPGGPTGGPGAPGTTNTSIDNPQVTHFRPPLPSPEPEPGSESEIPDFLVGKHNIYDYLASIKEPAFQALLKVYVTFELSDRTGIRGTLSTCRRPKAVTWWSGRARPDRLPPFDSLKSFAESITLWWVTLQPHWRRIELGDISRVEADFDDWETLYQPGVNGLLNVVILAYWWAKILEERGGSIDDTYSWFVSDVSWVLSQLISVAPNGS